MNDFDDDAWTRVELLEWARAALVWCGAEDKPMYRALLRRVSSIDRVAPSPFVISVDISDDEALLLATSLRTVGVEPSPDPPEYGQWYDLRFDCFDVQVHFALTSSEAAAAALELIVASLTPANAARLRPLIDRYVIERRTDEPGDESASA